MLMPTVGSESGRGCPAVPAVATASARVLTWPILLLWASSSCDWLDSPVNLRFVFIRQSLACLGPFTFFTFQAT